MNESSPLIYVFIVGLAVVLLSLVFILNAGEILALFRGLSTAP